MDPVDEGDNVFKVPTTTAPRKSKSVAASKQATVQSNTVQHDNSTASTGIKQRQTNRKQSCVETSYIRSGIDESNILQNDTSKSSSFIILSMWHYYLCMCFS